MEESMSHQALNPPNFARAFSPYHQGVKCQPKNLIFVSGQVALDEKGQVVGKGDVKAQTRQVMENIIRVLREGGASLREVVKVTVFLINMDHLKPVAEVRGEYFKDHLPASTLVQVSSLVQKELLVEIEAVAATN